MASYSHVWLSKYPINGPHSNYPNHPPTSPQHSWPKSAPSLQGPDLSNCIKPPCLCLVCSPSQKSSLTFYLRKPYSFKKSSFSHRIFSDHSDHYGVVFSWNSDSLISVKNSLNFPQLSISPTRGGAPFSHTPSSQYWVFLSVSLSPNTITRNTMQMQVFNDTTGL